MLPTRHSSTVLTCRKYIQTIKENRTITPLPGPYSNDESPIVMYYQTVKPIDELLKQQTVPLSSIVIYLSAFHFKRDEEGIVQLYLNDEIPQNQPELLASMESLQSSGVRIMMMLGGAGGAYKALFKDYDACVSVLFDFLRENLWISGIDLDVEENVGLDHICKLITTLNRNVHSSFAITMSPIAEAMLSDIPGLGGFSYTQLCERPEGDRINWFNVQCYGSYDCITFRSILNNGHAPERIVFGMLGDEFDDAAFKKAVNALYLTWISYPKLRGAALWEFGDTKISPLTFVDGVYSAFNSWVVSARRIIRLTGDVIYAAVVPQPPDANDALLVF